MNNIPYSLAPSATALVSGTHTVPLSPVYKGPAIPNGASLVQIGNSGLKYVIGTQIPAPGGSALTIGGVRYSLAAGADALVSGSSTIAFTPGKNYPQILAADGNIRTTDSVSNYVIGTKTLTPGSHAITVNGIRYSLALSATALVSGSNTIRLDNGLSYPPPVVTIAGGTYTANSASQYLIGSQTLAPGGQAITINGITYSLAHSATALVSNGITIPLTSSTPPVSTALTIGGTIYPENAASEFIIGTQTLLPNGKPITINSTPYAFTTGPSGEALIIDGKSTFLLSPPIITRAPAVISIGSALFTANKDEDFVIDGQTLVPGSEITFSGTEVSLGVEGTDVVLGGTSTEAVDLGSLIIGGFGGGSTPTGTGTGTAGGAPVVFEGGAVGGRRRLGRRVWGVAVGVGFVGFLSCGVGW